MVVLAKTAMIVKGEAQLRDATVPRAKAVVASTPQFARVSRAEHSLVSRKNPAGFAAHDS